MKAQNHVSRPVFIALIAGALSIGGLACSHDQSKGDQPGVGSDSGTSASGSQASSQPSRDYDSNLGGGGSSGADNLGASSSGRSR